jgi:GNAT superfamily N-acetyltransferase
VPPSRQVLGPVLLFYAPPPFVPEDPGGVELLPQHEIEALFARLPRGEIAESGLAEVTSPVLGSRAPAGELAAVCRCRRWPNDVAHLSVLADPAHRRQGHAGRALAAAIRQALSRGLLPQWRAGAVASQAAASEAVARSVGLVQYGAELSLELA